MAKKRIYRAGGVESVDVATLLPLLAAGCIVAIDVAKEKFVVALATLAGEVVKLFRFRHPTETTAFLRVVDEVRVGLAKAKAKVTVAMEPTGTYGDAVRHQLMQRGVEVQMVSPKRTHDSRELFDGVPSLHDPKCAVLIAKLTSLDLGVLWHAPKSVVVQLRALVDLHRHEQSRVEPCFGRLEAELARHWPEFRVHMDVRTQKSALAVLAKITTPAKAAARADETRAVIREASRGGIGNTVIDGLIAGAATTLGVPAIEQQERFMRTLASQILDSRKTTEGLEEEMRKLAQSDEGFARLAKCCGVYTAAVLLAMCDPRRCATARQFEKACGLNLREKSSGEHRGRLSITKRGPGLVRAVLFLFALRQIQSSPLIRAWYMRRRGYTETSKGRAVVAVMRKLTKALFHVAKGGDFDPAKLVDARRLRVDEPAEKSVPVEQPVAATDAPTASHRRHERRPSAATPPIT